jgi:hypothetical protein
VRIRPSRYRPRSDLRRQIPSNLFLNYSAFTGRCRSIAHLALSRPSVDLPAMLHARLGHALNRKLPVCCDPLFKCSSLRQVTGEAQGFGAVVAIRCQSSTVFVTTPLPHWSPQSSSALSKPLSSLAPSSCSVGGTRAGTLAWIIFVAPARLLTPLQGARPSHRYPLYRLSHQQRHQWPRRRRVRNFTTRSVHLRV